MLCVLKHDKDVTGRVDELEVLDDVRVMESPQNFDLPLDFFGDTLHSNFALVQNFYGDLVPSNFIDSH